MQGWLLNVIIAVLLCATFLATLGVLVNAAFLITNAELDSSEKSFQFAIMAFSTALGWIYAFLAIVGLVFIRNLIDWMIDMEEHAHEIRQKLLNG